jgi:hypothetical protein
MSLLVDNRHIQDLLLGPDMFLMVVRAICLLYEGESTTRSLGQGERVGNLKVKVALVCTLSPTVPLANEYLQGKYLR